MKKLLSISFAVILNGALAIAQPPTIQNQQVTLSVLRNIYGLGSSVPSAFALHVVETTVGQGGVLPYRERRRMRHFATRKRWLVAA